MKSDVRVITPERLERMSRENVEYWLLHEMHRKAQDVDASLIRQALERIAPVTDADTEKAHLSLLTFHWEHDAEIAVRRRRRHRAHATMLVVLLLTLMTAVGFALGVNIWQVAYKWAAGQLFMQLRPNEGASLPVDDASGLEYIADVWGDAVYEMMMEHDIHVRLPAWKPEGFELESVTYRQISASILICRAIYHSQDSAVLTLTIRKASDPHALTFLDATLQADSALQVKLVVEDMTFFVMSNIQTTSLTWTDDVTHIVIAGDFSSKDTEDMIYSIR